MDGMRRARCGTIAGMPEPTDPLRRLIHGFRAAQLVVPCGARRNGEIEVVEYAGMFAEVAAGVRPTVAD